MSHRLRAAIVCAFLALAACGTGEEPALEPPPEAEGTPGADGGPSVTIASPEDGATVEAGGVEIVASPEDFDIVNKLGQAPAAGEGHIHYYVDVDEIPTTPGQPAVSEEGTYHAEATTRYTWPDVQAGEHTFAVQLVNNDHTPLEPPVTAEVTVTVE
jgi:hypothetical protein